MRILALPFSLAQIRQPIVFILIINSLLVCLTSCSLLGIQPAQDNSEAELFGAQASTQKADSQLRQDSEAVRRFLMSELLLGQEQEKAALSNLEQSQRLLGQPDFQIQLNLAKLYLAQGQLDSALEALENFDFHPDLIRLKAALLLADDKTEEGLAAYQALNKMQPEDIQALLFLAYSDFDSSNHEAAKQKLSKILEIDPRSLPAIKLLAKVYLALEDYANVYQQTANYRTLDYSDEQVLKLFIISAYNLAKLDEISAELVKESKIRPNSSVVRTTTGLLQSPVSTDQGKELMISLSQELLTENGYIDLRKESARLSLLRQDYNSAAEDLQIVLLQQPKNSEVRYSLALALSSTGKLKAAINELEQIKSKDPWYVRAKSFQALLYKQAGDLQETKYAFEQALQKEPDNDMLKTALASTLTQLGEYKQAKKLYQAELEKNPANQAIMFSYAALLFDMQEQQQSLDLMQKIIQINPQHAEALNFLAYSLAEQGVDLDRALSLSQRAIQLEPENAFFLDTRGWIYFKLKKYVESLEDLQRAAKLSNFDPEVAEHLGDVYSSLSRKSEAKQSYNSAIDNLVDSGVERDVKSVLRLKEKLKALE